MTAQPVALSRRRFLVGAGASAAGALALPSLWPRYAFATPGDPATGDALVVVFLRGGADGLSLVPPFSDTRLPGATGRRGRPARWPSPRPTPRTPPPPSTSASRSPATASASTRR